MLVLTRKDLGLNRPAGEGIVVTKSSRRGVTLMEYLMMISLIVVVCLVAIGYLGSSNNTNMSSSSNAITKAIKKGG